MKIRFIILFTVLCSYLIYSQTITQKFQLKNQFILPEKNISIEDCIYKQYNNTFYYMKRIARNVNKNEYLDLWEISARKSRKLKLWIPKTDWIISFAVASKYIYILTQSDILIYNSKNGGFVKSIPVNKMFMEIKSENDYVILMTSCSTCDQAGVFSSIYNVNDGSLVREHVFSEVNGIEFLAIGPRFVIDYYNGKFIVSNIIDYSFTIYDKYFNLICKYNNNDSVWNRNSQLKAELKKMNTEKSQIHKATNKLLNLANNYSLVNLVNFIDDDRILINYSKYDDKSKKTIMKFDIWKIVNNQIVIDSKELLTQMHPQVH